MSGAINYKRALERKDNIAFPENAGAEAIASKLKFTLGSEHVFTTINATKDNPKTKHGMQEATCKAGQNDFDPESHCYRVPDGLERKGTLLVGSCTPAKSVK